MKKMSSKVLFLAIGAGIILMIGNVQISRTDQIDYPANMERMQDESQVQEYYTVQAACYQDIAGAQKDFGLLKTMLTGKQLDKLRIELVGTYYTVRVGGFEEKLHAITLLSLLKERFPSAFVLSAHIKDFRIIQMHESNPPVDKPDGTAPEDIQVEVPQEDIHQEQARVEPGMGQQVERKINDRFPEEIKIQEPASVVIVPKSIPKGAMEGETCVSQSCHENFSKKKVLHAPLAEGKCLACHYPHGSEEKFLLRVGENQSSLCLTCHDSNMFTQNYGHGPVDLGICSYCHDPHGDTESLLRQNTQEICISCHMDFGQEMQQAAFLHSAMQERSCSGCHYSHGSEYPGLLRQEGEKLCFECHGDVENKFANSKVKHEALYVQKGCENCHLVHFSDFEHLLYKPEVQVCFDCHGQDNSSRSKPLRNIRSEVEGKAVQHGAGHLPCTSCHGPHGTDYSRLLTASYPTDFYAPYTSDTYYFCFQCHEEDLLEEKEENMQTNFRNGKQNLHSLHVARKQKGRSCQACHQSHASDGPKLISSTGSRFGSWLVPLRFVISETGGTCTPGCHQQVEYDRENPVDYK